MRVETNIRYNIKGQGKSATKDLKVSKETSLNFKFHSQDRGCCMFVASTDPSNLIEDFLLEINLSYLPSLGLLNLFGFKTYREYLDFSYNFIMQFIPIKDSIHIYKHKTVDYVHINIPQKDRYKTRLLALTLFRYIWSETQYINMLLIKLMSDKKEYDNPMEILWAADQMFSYSGKGSYGYCFNRNSTYNTLDKYIKELDLNKNKTSVTGMFSSTAFPSMIHEGLKNGFSSIWKSISSILNSPTEENYNKYSNDIYAHLSNIFTKILYTYKLIGKEVSITNKFLVGFNQNSKYKINDIVLKNKDLKQNIRYKLLNDEFLTTEVPQKFCKILN